MAGINFKAFDLGGHEIARRVWKDYYAKVRPGCAAACAMASATNSRLRFWKTSAEGLWCAELDTCCYSAC